MPCDNSKASSDIEHVEWSTGTGSGHHYTNVRFGSSSSQASQSSGDICRICHCESDPLNPLLTPCYCSGSLKYVHQTCLQQWLTASETNSCELCKFPFIMHTKIKPFNEWRSLDISGIERRRLCCSVLFHCAAALCVIWSLCVLIERAAEDVQRGAIDWPFWTKLAVVTVGLTGGIVFMYIQCKAYLHLCHRWKARNRILLIQNAPEKIHPISPPSPAAQHRANRSSGTANEPHTSQTGGGNMSGMACAEISGNITQTSNGYDNYAPQMNNLGTNMACTVVSATSPRFLASSPHHMLDDGDLDVNSHGSHSISSDVQHIPSHHHRHHHHHHPHMSHHNHHHHGHVGQVAVAANIECTQSQQNYERDWALDDVVSQISSFRPCPQGSGSMTPFHDSIHNVLEHSEDSSRISTNDLCVGSRQDLSTDCISSDTGREHALQLSSFSAGSGEHKAPSISSGVSHAVANGLGGFVYKPHIKRYSNSSIFLENRDILNDSVTMGLESTSSSYDYPKADYHHRHSGILTPPDGGETYFGRDLRRHSDTKLLGSVEADVHDPMLYNTPPDDYQNNANVLPGHSIKNNAADSDTATCKRIRHLLKQHSANEVDTVIDMELPTSPLFPPPPAAFTNSNTNSNANANSKANGNTNANFHHGLHYDLDEEEAAAAHKDHLPHHLVDEVYLQDLHQHQQQQKQNLRHSLDLIDSSGGIFANSYDNDKRNCETPEYVNGFIAKQYRQEQQLLQQQQQQQKQRNEAASLEQNPYQTYNNFEQEDLPRRIMAAATAPLNPGPNPNQSPLPTVNPNSNPQQQPSDLSKVFFKSLPNLSSKKFCSTNK